MNARIPETQELLKTAVEASDDGATIVITDSTALRRALSHRGVVLFGSDIVESRLEELPRAVLAVVDAAAGFPSGKAAVQLVSRLRDVHADRVLVIAGREEDTHLGRHELIGLGFQRWASSHDPDGRRRWYEFDIGHYKVTPDWLSPRNWANPERWDKYRW